ncbi:MAG: hypothetical protein H6695_13520 [Deferribacteres bacterium]|nr:hypothetical protein [candidate division KSB1 bacterium]MCB9511204.1 hypothetical protein [Deferribacteres bacterium]
MDLFKEQQNRREFFRTCARNVSLSALGLFGGVMLWRKHDENDEHVCINEFLCNGCSVLPTCILPQGQSARQASDKKVTSAGSQPSDQ